VEANSARRYSYGRHKVLSSGGQLCCNEDGKAFIIEKMTTPIINVIN
jgi:hypothetical protein